jgi:secreted trypsin-like serine protease
VTKALVLAAVLASVVATQAQAITYGQPDENRHPEVGGLVTTSARTGEQYVYCSGTLISTTVLLTAAHCDIGTSTVCVTFDPQLTSRSRLYCGTFYAHPQYNQSQDDPLDIAVVVFDRPIRGIEPAQLPTLGLLDAMRAAGTLNGSTQFTAVGYGGLEFENAPGGKQPTYLDTRMYATSGFNALGPGYLRLSQNPSVGFGGTCYGDSGGPNFLGAGATETNIIAGITITGDAFCRSTNVTQRLDTEAARAFLGQFVTLP